MKLLYFFLLWSLFVSIAQAQTCPARPLLGSNETMWLVSPISGTPPCSSPQRQAFHSNAVLTQYATGEVRATVQNQLAQMVASGTRVLRTIVYFTSPPCSPCAPENFVLPLTSGPGSPLQNISDFTTDVANSGITLLLLAFGPQGANSPNTASGGIPGAGFNPALTPDNWAAISAVHDAAKAAAPGLQIIYDISQEGCPSNLLVDPQYTQRKTYFNTLITNYLTAYPTETDDWTFSCGDTFNGQSGLTRMSNLLTMLSPGPYPIHFEQHIYQEDCGLTTSILKGNHDDLASIPGATLTIGEMYMGNLKQNFCIQQAVTSIGGLISPLYAWVAWPQANRNASSCGFSYSPPNPVYSFQAALTGGGSLTPGGLQTAGGKLSINSLSGMSTNGNPRYCN